MGCAGAPDAGGGGVAEAAQRVAAGLRVAGAQAQLLLHLVDDPAPAGVDAEVLEGAREVRRVGLARHAKDLWHSTCMRLQSARQLISPLLAQDPWMFVSAAWHPDQ